jgi:hypothetical protein
VHNAGQTHTGWWTTWLKRAHEHIQPAYLARGDAVDPRLRDKPYHAHPRQLVSNEGEPQCMPQPERVDVSWLIKHGIPRPGQMIVVRLAQIKEPFGVGVVRSVRGLTEAARAEIAQVEADERNQETADAQADAQAAAAAPAAVAATSGGRRKAPTQQGLRNAALTLKQFEVTFVYWDIHPDQFTKEAHLVVAATSRKAKAEAAEADVFWHDLCVSNGVELKDLQAALKKATDAHSPPPPCRGFIVDVHKKLTFIPPAQKLEEVPETINGAMSILWGARTLLFCQGKVWREGPDGRGQSMRKDTFIMVRQDLTEQYQQPVAAMKNVSEPPPPADAADTASADDDGPRFMELDEHEEQPASSAAAAAAAAGAPRRVSSRKRHAAVLHDERDSDEGEHEQKESDDEQYDEDAEASEAEQDGGSESEASLPVRQATTRSRSARQQRSAPPPRNQAVAPAACGGQKQSGGRKAKRGGGRGGRR